MQNARRNDRSLAAWMSASVLSLALAACGSQSPSVPPLPPEQPPAPQQPGPGSPDPAAPTPAPPPTPEAAACPSRTLGEEDVVLQTLSEKARTHGKVRVIVRVEQPAGVQTVAARRAGIEAFVQAGVPTVAPVADRLPLLVAEVTEQQLTAMYDAAPFAKWVEDRIAFTSLADSTPLVGAPALWALGGRGAGQGVVIVDTGVDRTHPFLQGRVVAEACFSTNSLALNSTSVCPGGATAQTGEGAARPCMTEGCDHGTHVAGIAAGRGDTFSGVAPDADIIAIQVFSRFSGSACGGLGADCIASFTSDQIRALDYVASLAGQRKIAAVNMSLGGGRSTTTCDDDPTKAPIDQLRALGIATAIASGNDGYRDAVSFPSCVSTAVTVGASSKQDRLAPFSNCSPTVDLNAPGVSIRSSVPGRGFANFSGTSMATPHVAGAFAVLKSLNPTASVDAIEAALKSTGLNVEGRPRIDLQKANASLKPSQENVVVAQVPSDRPGVTPARAQLDATPAGDVVRVIVAVKADKDDPAAVAQAVAEAETAARAAGITHIERMGSQPMLVIEGRADQVRKLQAAEPSISVQMDRLGRTQ